MRNIARQRVSEQDEYPANEAALGEIRFIQRTSDFEKSRDLNINVRNQPVLILNRRT